MIFFSWKGRKNMKNGKQSLKTNDKSLRTAAVIGGIGLLLMAVLAAYANFGIMQNLVIQGDVQATAENIMASGGSLLLAVISFLIVAILDVIVAWSLYIILKQGGKSLALIAAWLRVIYAAIFAFSLTKLFNVARILSAPVLSQPTDLVYGQAMNQIDAFQKGWDTGLILFGLHLLFLALISFKSGALPKWLGALLAVAGLGYLVDSIGAFFFPAFNISIGEFTFFGELILIFWMLWKGIKGFPPQKETLK